MVMLDARDGVRRAIRESGMKQSVVAARAGLTEQQLCDIVNKRRKLEANEMFAICVVVGTTPNDLFEATDNHYQKNAESGV